MAGSALAPGVSAEMQAQLKAGLAASQRQVQALQQLLFDRNKLITELEAQLLGVSDDIKTFEAMVIRVETMTNSLVRRLPPGSYLTPPRSMSFVSEAI